MLDLNEREVPAVSSLDRASLTRLVAMSAIAIGAIVDADIAEFIHNNRKALLVIFRQDAVGQRGFTAVMPAYE